jgi:hypothetical protein
MTQTRSAQSLTNARRSVSARLVGLELPDAFAAATVAAAVIAQDRKRPDAKRLVRKAYRIAEVSR